jgi:hypothetical protein
MRRLPTRARRIVGASLAAALFLAAAAPARAAPGDPPPAPPAPAGPAFAPEAVKAAYLVNFLRFTDWPSPPAREAPYVIGVAGNRALEDELLRLADRQLVRGHRLRVVRLRSARDLDGVHLAFFDASSDTQTDILSPREALPALARRPVLSVSDSPNFLPLGGIVQLYREESALRFAIAPERARESGLVISSRLLALARIHREEPASP